MSSMVDKINYNFTLVSLKGGGPAGVQGIQGIRGYNGIQGMQGIKGNNGASIHPGDPTDMEDRIIGDIYIHDGVIQQVNEFNEVVDITNLNLAVQSPFGVPDDDTLRTINPNPEYADRKFVIGASTSDDTVNSIITVDTTDPAKIYIASDNKHIKFYNPDFSSLAGHIGYAGSSLVMQSETGSNIKVSGAGNYYTEWTDRYIKVNGDFSTIAAFNTSDIYLLLGVNSDKKLAGNRDGYDHDKYWAVDNVSNNALFPISNDVNDIGKEQTVNGNTRIDNMYFNKDSYMKFVGDDTQYMNIVADKLTGNPNSRPIITMSKDGVAIGGLKSQSGQSSSAKSLCEDFDTNNKGFSIKLNTPANNADYGTILSMYSSTKVLSALVTTETNVWTNPNFEQSINVESDWTNTHHITLSQNMNANIFMREAYSNLITVDRKINTHYKTPNNTLHIHGADSYIRNNAYFGVGGDVVLSGGNSINSSASEYFGGNIYISGGSAMRNNNGIDFDSTRFGNVIIGINPFHHKGGFRGAYTADDNKMTDTDPTDVSFFDINKVAVHGNKIVLDSNANFRVQTKGFIAKEPDSNIAPKRMTPWAQTKEDTTLQVSCINTINHKEPIILTQREICSHQFMSGVMQRTMRFTVDANNNIEMTDISGLNLMNQLDNTNGTVFFITEHVWQKVGNVVNVQTFGRWLASKPGDTNNLYHITDHFFANQNTNLYAIGDWFTGAASNRICRNKVLGKWMLKPDGSDYRADTPYGETNVHPETMFVLPISVSNMNSSFCYGIGNIFTEDACTFTQTRNNPISHDPTKSVLQSANVMVGGYHKLVGNAQFGRTSGDRSALHDENYNKAWKNDGVFDFKSISSDINDVRLTDVLIPNNYLWCDSRYVKTEIKIPNWQYIIPDMMVNDISNDTPDVGNYRRSKRMRPCVGAYTWISLNYSYNIMSGFNTDDYVVQFEKDASQIGIDVNIE